MDSPAPASESAPRMELRWVQLEGAYNFRDLGGYDTEPDGSVRWGRVYRSDALHHVSAGDVAALLEMGLERVIDLRSPAEVEHTGRGLLAESGVEYVDAPVIPELGGEASGAPPGNDTAARYMWYLEVGRGAFVETFSALAEPVEGATVFHCAAGKDRTGVVAAMLLSVLGVRAEDIARDYALTDLALPSILGRLADDPVHGPAIAALPPERRHVDPAVMSRFLGLIGEAHGGAEDWLVGAGLPAASVNSLRASLRTAP